MAFKPHGFDKEELPHIKLTPYMKGGAGATSIADVNKTMKEIVDKLKGGSKDKKDLGKKIQSINEAYYGSSPDTAGTIFIPITDSFKMSAENEYETIDPSSAFTGAFGAGAMVGTNVMGVNNVVGKAWAGSNVGIGTFSFSVAVDTSIKGMGVDDAVNQNRKYINQLKKLFMVSRPVGSIGVLKPPSFCQLTSSWGFNRKYIGIKSLNIETVGMWVGNNTPLAYNITMEVEDLVLGLTGDES